MTEAPSTADPSELPSTGGVVSPGMGLDPRIALATSVHASPGVYGLLLGSGVSTAAGIPTGWQVVSELVARVAAAGGGDDDAVAAARSDPEAWWLEHGDGQPLGYSSLLAALAPSSAARRQLLAGFFEPSEEDREEGRKTSRRAHHAVAELVARGAVRVILTTNFDRLTERALEERGIAPQVISRPEQIAASMPLTHARVTVIKLHGDYFDLDQRNTIDELSSYEPALDGLLDRIFDEYGLILCGWSGDWDHALVAALDRCPRRRFPLFWSSYGRPGEVASRLIASHQAAVIQGDSADEFFDGLLERLRSLDRLAAPPLSRDMAVAQLKRYLADERRRIDVFDLVDAESRKVAANTADQGRYPVTTSAGLELTEHVDRQLDDHRRDTDTLLHLLAHGVFHDQGAHDALWTRVLTQLVNARTFRGGSVTRDVEALRHHPALLALWTVGISCVLAGREALLVRMLAEVRWQEPFEYRAVRPICDVLNPSFVVEAQLLRELPSAARRHHYPHTPLLRNACREVFAQIEPSDDTYALACLRVEVLASLVAQIAPDSRRYHWAGEWLLNGRYTADRVPPALSDAKDVWLVLAAQELNASSGDAEDAYNRLVSEAQSVRHR